MARYSLNSGLGGWTVTGVQLHPSFRSFDSVAVRASNEVDCLYYFPNARKERKNDEGREGVSLRPIHILRLRADRQLLNAPLPLRKRDLFFKLPSQAVWPRAESSRLSRIVTGIILALCPYICKERESLFLCCRRQLTYLRISTQHLQVLQP